jgi:hypothetical protein
MYGPSPPASHLLPAVPCPPRCTGNKCAGLVQSPLQRLILAVQCPAGGGKVLAPRCQPHIVFKFLKGNRVLTT